jgi:hypothetical protein
MHYSVYSYKNTYSNGLQHDGWLRCNKLGSYTYRNYFTTLIIYGSFTGVWNKWNTSIRQWKPIRLICKQHFHRTISRRTRQCYEHQKSLTATFGDCAQYLSNIHKNTYKRTHTHKRLNIILVVVFTTTRRVRISRNILCQKHNLQLKTVQ